MKKVSAKQIFRTLTGPEAGFCLFLVLLLLPNILLSITEKMGFFALTANIVLPLGVYAFLMTLSKNIGRSIWIFLPIVLLSISQVVLLGIYGRSVIAVDMFLNLTTSNPNESGELFGSIFPIIALVAILYLPSLIAGIWMWAKKINLPDMFRRYTRRVSIALMIYGIVCVFIAGVMDRKYRVKNDLYPVNAGYNLSLAAEQSYRIADRKQNGQTDFKYNARATHPDSIRELYVLVIGETSRADHWQINGYNRPTTPRLSARKNLFSFPKALSESNTTFKSVPMLLSHLDATTYGDSIYVVKSLLSAFKEAGFSTAYLSSQTPNRSYIQFFSEEADTTAYINPSAKENDLILLPAVKGIMDENRKKQLIVVHSYGSHFSYRDRYPEEMAYFKPDDYKDIRVESRALLINAYDNAVRLTDALVDGIIEQVSECGDIRAGVIYMADHGEDLYDDGRGLLLHSSPCPTFYQLHVPFMVWLSPVALNSEPEYGKALMKNVKRRISTSVSVFQTLLDMAGVRTPVQGTEHSVLNDGYIVPNALFLNDHNHPVTLEESGFVGVDFRHYNEMMRKP